MLNTHIEREVERERERGRETERETETDRQKQNYVNLKEMFFLRLTLLKSKTSIILFQLSQNYKF